MKLNIKINTIEHVIREADPDDEWDNGSHRDEHEIIGAEIVDDEFSQFEVEGVKEGDTLYFVYALYNTGDTFGSYENKLCDLALLRHLEDAEYLYDCLEKDSKTVQDQSDFESMFKPLSVTYPKCGITETIGVSTWKGYFESLNSFEIAAVEISKKKRR
jgi:hypothetical protein